MLAFLLFTLVLIHSPPTFDIDHRIKPYVNEVIKLSKGKLKGTSPVLVKNLKLNHLGYCYYGAIRHIEIDFKKFSQYTHKEKLAIIAHEMMHCEYTCGHNNRILKDDCHASLMHKSTQIRDCYEKHWDRYVKEMQEVDC